MKNKTQNAQNFPNWQHALFDTVIVWQRRENMSRESVALSIYEGLAKLGGAKQVGVDFASDRNDTFLRGAVLAQKLFRWLDAESDGAVLPLNLTYGVIFALPSDLRLQFFQRATEGLGVSIMLLPELNARPLLPILAALAKESGEAVSQALLLKEGGSLSEVRTALVEAKEAKSALESLIVQLEYQLEPQFDAV
jgi:hypothetical protein